MVFDPFVCWGDSNTKLTIIHALNNYGSLSAKKVHNHLKKEFGISATYQAVHKALKKMHECKIVDFVNNEYRINEVWVRRMRVFADELEKNPKTISEMFSVLEGGKAVNFTARNESEMGYFVLDFATHYSMSGGKGPVFMNLFYVWTILPLNDEQFQNLKKLIKKHKIYVVSREGMVYDKIMKRHWEDAGGKVSIGVRECVSNCEVVVLGDYIMSIYWDTKKLERDILNNESYKDESSINYNQIYEMITESTKIDFVIIKNKEVAEKIRQKTLSYFK